MTDYGKMLLDALHASAPHEWVDEELTNGEATIDGRFPLDAAARAFLAAVVAEPPDGEALREAVACVISGAPFPTKSSLRNADATLSALASGLVTTMDSMGAENDRLRERVKRLEMALREAERALPGDMRTYRSLRNRISAALEEPRHD